MGATSEHFSESELSCKGRNCCGRKNQCLPELLSALEELRTVIGKPITIMSAYRCAEHNALIGGAKNSMHVAGIAADIRVTGMSAAQLEQAARKVPVIHGIGRDDFGNDLHVDVRSVPARWCYAKDGRTIPYYPPKEES